MSTQNAVPSGIKTADELESSALRDQITSRIPMYNGEKISYFYPVRRQFFKKDKTADCLFFTNFRLCCVHNGVTVVDVKLKEVFRVTVTKKVGGGSKHNQLELHVRDGSVLTVPTKATPAIVSFFERQIQVSIDLYDKMAKANVKADGDKGGGRSKKQSKEGFTLWQNVLAGKMSAARAFVERGGDVHAICAYSESSAAASALQLCISIHQHDSMAAFLLRAGCAYTHVHCGDGVLQDAVLYSLPETVEALFDVYDGDAAKLANSTGIAENFSVLSLACMHGHDVIVNYLIDKGADVNWTRKRLGGSSVLHDACWGDYIKLSIVKTLVAKGADVAFVTESGTTVLMQACTFPSGRDDVVAYLLQAIKSLTPSLPKRSQQTAHINLQNEDDGHAALHLAIHAKRQKAAKMLVKRGADPELPDKQGQTPRALAEEMELTDLVEYFDRHISERAAAAAALSPEEKKETEKKDKDMAGDDADADVGDVAGSLAGLSGFSGSISIMAAGLAGPGVGSGSMSISAAASAQGMAGLDSHVLAQSRFASRVPSLDGRRMHVKKGGDGAGGDAVTDSDIDYDSNIMANSMGVNMELLTAKAAQDASVFDPPSQNRASSPPPDAKADAE